jgi:hypothetical protein
MMLGLEVSPPSGGDVKCSKGGLAVKVGFVCVKPDGREINIGSNPCGRVVKWGLVSVGGRKGVELLLVMKSGRVLLLEVRKVEPGWGLRVRFEGLTELELDGRVVKLGLVARDTKTLLPEGRADVDETV